MAEGTVLQFNADLQAFSRALDMTVVEGAKLAALAVHIGVTEKMPVDTGRARGSTGLSLDAPGGYELPEGEYGADGGAARAREQRANLDAYTESNPYREIWIFNNLPYIEALENGHSRQAPLGMFAVTLAEVEAGIDAQLEAIAAQHFPQ